MTGGRFGSGWRRGRLQVLSSSLATVLLPSRAYPVTVRFPFGWQDAYAATAHSAPYLDAESLMFRRPEEGKRWHRSLRASRSREAPKRYSRTSRTLRICPNGKGVSSAARGSAKVPSRSGRAVVTRRIGRREQNMT